MSKTWLMMWRTYLMSSPFRLRDASWLLKLRISQARLRVLSLEKQNITELPDSVQGLRYLRYVNLSYTLIRSLPDSICSLLILQVFLLRDCSWLMELPTNMGNLINLRHLDIKGTNLVREMPMGMSKLKCLRTLSNFIVSKGTGYRLDDLMYLKFLSEELCISRLDNVTSFQDTRDCVLIDKKDLKVLLLDWGSSLDDARNELVEKNVLDMLQPHTNLEELTIKNYTGPSFSSWVGDPSFSKMVVLRLESCKNCTSLPALGCLEALKELTIKGMAALKSIGSEIYGRHWSDHFYSLKTLGFEDLQEWERWDPVSENAYIQIFPNLCELSLVNCPKLVGKLPDHLPSLKKLIVRECGQLMVRFSSLPVFCELDVDG